MRSYHLSEATGNVDTGVHLNSDGNRNHSHSLLLALATLSVFVARVRVCPPCRGSRRRRPRPTVRGPRWRGSCYPVVCALLDAILDLAALPLFSFLSSSLGKAAAATTTLQRRREAEAASGVSQQTDSQQGRHREVPFWRKKCHNCLLKRLFFMLICSKTTFFAPSLIVKHTHT